MRIALIRRGDIFDVDLPEPGVPPGVVVTLQEAIPVRTNVTIVMLTSLPRGRPTEVPVESLAGLDRPSTVACDEIYTVKKEALLRRRGTLPYEAMLRVDDALRLSLGLR